jgi:hypothetical protein
MLSARRDDVGALHGLFRRRDRGRVEAEPADRPRLRIKRTKESG